MGAEKGSLVKEKKRALLHYSVWLAQERAIEEEIELLRQRKMSTSISLDGMPKASGHSDLSEYAARLDELEEKLHSTRLACLNARLKIETAVYSLSDIREQRLMKLRYIDCDTWQEVADEMGYEVRQVYNIHGQALLHIRI